MRQKTGREELLGLLRLELGKAGASSPPSSGSLPSCNALLPQVLLPNSKATPPMAQLDHAPH